MANIKCVDVSEWQGNIDWKKVYKAGYTCAILRAGFGRYASQKDKCFDTNYKNAKAAGVKLGAYWYSYAVDKADAIKEAKACISILKGKTFELPVFFDMEENSMKKLGKKTLTEMAKAFCDTLKSAGYRAGVYSNLDWFTNYLDYNSLKKLYPIWYAQYYKEAQMDCDIWQYSSTGKVSGISGSVDMNVIYNSSVIKSEEVKTTQTEKKEETPVLETAALQVLLRLSMDLGVVKTNVTPVNNIKGRLTNAAIIEAREFMGYKNPTSDVDMDFICSLDKTLREKLALLASGDVNGDGKVDIKDATQIQRKVAGF